MAGETLTTFADFLKVFYVMGIRSIINKASYFRFRLNTSSVSGKTATVPLQRGLLPTGSRGENDTNGLPAPGELPKEQAIIPLVYHYARIQFSGIVEAASAQDIGAFIDVMTSTNVAAMDSLKLTLNIQCMLNNDGLLATVGAQFNGGATGAVAAVSMTVDTTQYMYPGMRIGCHEASGYAEMDTGLIIDTITSATTFKCTGTVGIGIEASDLVYIFQNRGKQEYGLGDIFNETNTYLGVVRTNIAEWIPNMGSPLSNSSVNRTIDLNLMQTAIDLAEANCNGNISAIHCREAVRRAYTDHLVNDRRYNYPETMHLDGGFTGLTYTGGSKAIPIVAERFIPANKMYFLDESTFNLYKMGEGLNWIPGPIAGIFHSLLTAATSTDGVQAGLRLYENIACTNPRKSSLLSDITEE